MTTSRPDVQPEGLYNQTQAARALGIDRHTVKRYEDNGAISFRVRRCNGQKVTTGKQIINCWERMYL